MSFTANKLKDDQLGNLLEPLSVFVATRITSTLLHFLIIEELLVCLPGVNIDGTAKCDPAVAAGDDCEEPALYVHCPSVAIAVEVIRTKVTSEFAAKNIIFRKYGSSSCCIT